MMGALENNYGVYFPSDGEVVYIHPTTKMLFSSLEF